MPEFEPEYVYVGDRLTDPQLVGLPVMAVRCADGKCVRGSNFRPGANGNMLVKAADGRRFNVLGRLLRKRKIPHVRKVEEA